jgi:triacylglycerol esterase/lipase EstA (alpha/beta hydrolase family)
MPARLAPLVVVLALALPAPAFADAPVVPILSGGELHWVGSAHREFHERDTDELGGHYYEDHQSDVAWDTRMLVAGNYADAPAVDFPNGFVLATESKTTLGSGSSHIDELDCYSPGECEAPTSHDCTWTETTNGAGGGPIDDPPGQRWAVASMGGTNDGRTNYTCADQYNVYNPSLFENCELVPDQADACGTIVTFPPTPLEGDAAATITEHFDHSAPDANCGPADVVCPQTGSSTLTISCALCVTGIHYQQPDLPGRGWADVPSTGTFDGNEVRISATVHNATGKDITAPVRFRDLTTQRDLPAATGGQQPAGEVTFPANADTQVVLDWDTEGFAWYAPHTSDPHKISVLTPYGGAREDLRVRPKPVLLVHGYNSDATTWDGYPDLFKGRRDDWLAQAVSGMNTNPDEGNTLLGNAQILGHAIAKLRDDQDAEHVDLVVHSMGGLISRQYLQSVAPSDPDNRPVVSHLVMLGTPNLGSECAYVAYASGSHGWPTIQLMPTYLITKFNPVVTDTKGTKLSVLAGTSKLGAITNSVCGLNEPNDLVVWKNSAFWTLSDTALQPGLRHTSMTGDAQAFNSFVAPHLAVTPDGPAARRSVRAAAARALAAKAPARPGMAVDGLALAQRAKIPAHRTRRVALRVAGGRAVGVMVLAPGGMRAALLDPRGRAVATTTSDGSFAQLAARVHRRGTWHVALTNRGAQVTTVTVAARIDRDPFVVAPSLKRHGKRLTLTVRVRGAGARPGVTALAHALAKRGGKSRRVRLRRRGARYGATLKPLAGGTIVTVTVRGARGKRIAEASAG